MTGRSRCFSAKGIRFSLHRPVVRNPLATAAAAGSPISRSLAADSLALSSSLPNVSSCLNIGEYPNLPTYHWSMSSEYCLLAVAFASAMYFRTSETRSS